MKDELAYMVNHNYREGYDAGLEDLWAAARTDLPPMQAYASEEFESYKLSEPVLGYDPTEQVFAVVVCEIGDGVRIWSDYNSGESFGISCWWPLPAVPGKQKTDG